MNLTWPPDKTIPPADTIQKKAAEIFKAYGRLCVEAAPGTGKTFLGIYLAICAYQLGWTSIDRPTLILTFSRNAKVQIEHAIQLFRKENWITKDQEKSIQIFNYHAFFLEYLKKKAGVWGCKLPLTPSSGLENRTRLESFLGIVDEKFYDQANLIFSLKRYSIKDLLSIKSQLLFTDEEITKIYSNAKENLISGNLYYDDFAPLFLNLLEHSPEFLEWLRIKYPVYIFDEFQDTDLVQWDIIKMIKPIHPVFLYDRYQMIYEWRGSRSNRIDDLKRTFNISQKQETEITNNHRCSIQGSFPKFIQDLRRDDLKGNCICKKDSFSWLSLKSIPMQSDRYLPPETRCLLFLRFGKIINPSERTAILTRSNNFAGLLYEKLRTRPEKGPFFKCHLFGSINTPDEQIRDILWGYKTITSDLQYRVWLGTIIDYLLPLSDKKDLDVEFSTEFALEQENFLKKRKKPIFHNIKGLWDPYWKTLIVNDVHSFSIHLELALKTVSLIVQDKAYLDPDLIYFIKKLIIAAKLFSSNSNDSINDDFYLHLLNSHLQASYLRDHINSTCLSILTIHQSKGREFDHIIIPWLSRFGEPTFNKDGKRQHFGAGFDIENLEDRKLLYVAITRAKSKVSIIHPSEDPSLFIKKWFSE